MSDNLHTIFTGSECPPHSVLRDYFLRKLTDEEMYKVEQHLVDCEMCSDELEGLSKMKDLRDLDVIVGEIDESIASKRRRIVGIRRNYALMAAAALLLLIAGSIVIIRIMTETKPQTEMSVITPPVVAFQEQAPPPPQANAPAAGEQKPVQREKAAEKQVSETQPVTVADEATLDAGGIAEAPIETEEQEVAGIQQAGDTLRENVPVQIYAVPEGKAEDRKLAREISGVAVKKTETQATLMDVAMAEYNEGHYQQAAVFFEQVSGNDPSNHKASYYLAVCYYHNDELKKASRLLKHIIRSPEDPYYAPAKELMDKIREK